MAKHLHVMNWLVSTAFIVNIVQGEVFEQPWQHLFFHFNSYYYHFIGGRTVMTVMKELEDMLLRGAKHRPKYGTGLYGEVLFRPYVPGGTKRMSEWVIIISLLWVMWNFIPNHSKLTSISRPSILSIMLLSICNLVRLTKLHKLSIFRISSQRNTHLLALKWIPINKRQVSRQWVFS